MKRGKRKMLSLSNPHWDGKVELVNLDPDADPDTLISSLSELNSILIILASSQPLSRSLRSTVLVLVELLGNTSDEVVLLTSRALTSVFDICPQSTAAAVEAGVVRALSRNLLSVTDMDIAEQCLNCLNLLAREMPRAVLEGNGIKACLEFYDFFSQELQGLALHSVSCLCMAADQESHVSYILEILPILCSMLGNKDSSATARGASLCFERLCCTFSSPPQDSKSNRVSSWQESFLEKLANCGVVEHWIGLLHDVGKRGGVRALPYDVFGYKPRQQIGHGQKAQSLLMAGGTLAGILCSLAKLVAAAPTVLYLVYKLDVSRVIGSLLESFISQPFNVDGVEETSSTSAGSCGRAWSSGTISSIASDFADTNAEDSMLQAMVFAVALLPPPGERSNKYDPVKVTGMPGMDGGEDQRDVEAKKKSNMIFEEEQGVVVVSSPMKEEVVKVPNVLELGIEIPSHDSNGYSVAQWSCLTCMLSNHFCALRCNVCGTIKSSLVPASVLPPPSVVSKASRSRDTDITSLQITPNREKLHQTESTSTSVPCDDNNANVVVLMTRYDVYSSSPMYLKDYLAHIFPPMLRLVPFGINEEVSVLILSALESLFDLGYLPDNSNLLWGVSAAIGQFLSSPNMSKDAVVRSVSLARKLLEAHDACNSLSGSSSSPRHDWWWGGNKNLENWKLYRRYGVTRRRRKTRKSHESLSRRDDNSCYRVMYVRHGVVHIVVSLLKSLCAATTSPERHMRQDILYCGGHDVPRIVLQTNLKWIILEAEVLAFLSAFASGDKWISAALNHLSPQQQQQQSKAASLLKQQTPRPCIINRSCHSPPLIQHHNNEQLQLPKEDAPAAAALPLVSILLGRLNTIIPASALDELEKKTSGALLAAAGDDDVGDSDTTNIAASAVEVQESKVLRKLRSVAESLKEKGPGPPPLKRNDATSSIKSIRKRRSDKKYSLKKEEDPALIALATILESEEDVTVHEMRESRILEALLDYFFATMKYPPPAMQYMGGFFKTFFSHGGGSSRNNNTYSVVPHEQHRLRILFDKIQECLSASSSFCTKVVHHGGKKDIMKYNALLHPFFLKVVPSETLIEAIAGDGGDQEPPLTISKADSNERTLLYNASLSLSPVVLIEPLTTAREVCAFLGNQLSSLTTTTTTCKLGINEKNMASIKELSIELERDYHLEDGSNEGEHVNIMHPCHQSHHVPTGKGGGRCTTAIGNNNGNRRSSKTLGLTAAGISMIQPTSQTVAQPSEVLCSVSEAEALLHGSSKQYRGRVFKEGENVVSGGGRRLLKRLRDGGVRSQRGSYSPATATSQNLKKKGKSRRKSLSEAAAAVALEPWAPVYVYLFDGEDKFLVCRKCTVVAMRDDGTYDLKDPQCREKGGIREAVPLSHIATSSILPPFSKQRTRHKFFQKEVMSDLFLPSGHQLEYRRKQRRRSFLNNSERYCVPMLRRTISGMVCGDQSVLASQKVQVFHQQRLQQQQQQQQQHLSQQPNITQAQAAQEGNRMMMRSFSPACTSAPTILPRAVGVRRKRSSEYEMRSSNDDHCTPDSNAHQQSKQSQRQTAMEPNSLLSRFTSTRKNKKSSTSNIHSGGAGASSVPEEAVSISADSIVWILRRISKSGEEYCIDLSSLPLNTTMFEVVQELQYMCERGERGREISSSNSSRLTAVEPEEWERTYYIDFDLKVLEEQNQKQKQPPHRHVKQRQKPKPPKLRGRIYSAKKTINDGKDWVTPICSFSSTSLDCTLHDMEHSLCQNKDFWALQGNFTTALHLLAVLQVLLDEEQMRCLSSMAPAAAAASAASIYPMLRQSRRLSTRLQRQCCDPLSMCTDTLPEWCKIFPSSFPSLLTLESRMLLFVRTAFGPAHSLNVVQDLSCLIEEEVGGRANSSSAAYEEEIPLFPSLASLEFDGGRDSTPLTKHNLTLYQHLRHLGRLRRLRVVVNRDHILPVSYALFSALVDSETREKEENVAHMLFVRRKGIGWKSKSGNIYGFPVMLKVVDGIQLKDEEDHHQHYIGMENSGTATPRSFICQREEDSRSSSSLHITDSSDMDHSTSLSGAAYCNCTFNHGTLDGILLVEFERETGYGTGPTQEFYTLICREMRKSGLGLWHGDGNRKYGTFLNPPEGLFPKPHPPGSKEQNSANTLFRLLGRVIGKSLKDRYHLDLPLALPLCKFLVGRGGTLTLKDVKGIDTSTGQSLEYIKNAFNCLSTAAAECSSTTTTTTRDDDIVKLKREAERLYLTWSLPGYSWYALRPGERDCNEDVDPKDMGQWLNDVILHLLIKSVEPQLSSLIQGINDIFNIDKFRIFSASELQDLLCGGGKQEEDASWAEKAILNNIVVGHGYTLDSGQVLNLVAIMSDFSAEQRRAFLCYATGTPRLPIGGFGALSPRLTIVHKAVGNDEKPDDFLPSCSTCQVYLKLPAYSSKDVMKAKLLRAMSEGQGYFGLD